MTIQNPAPSADASTYAAVDALLSAHGLRRTQAARVVLAWLLANPDTSYTTRSCSWLRKTTKPWR